MVHELVEKSLDIDPNNYFGHYASGLMMKDEERSAEARTHFEKAIVNSPRSTDAAQQLAELSFAEKKYWDAVRWAERAQASAGESSADIGTRMDEIIEESFGALSEQAN